MTDNYTVFSQLPEHPTLEDLQKAELVAKIAKLEAERHEFELNSEAKTIDLMAHKLKNSQNLVFTFYGAVVPILVNECIQTLSAWVRKSPGEEITIMINTPGGSIQDGLGLYDYIQYVKKTNPVTTKVFGQAASMGAVLLQAGSKRIMQPNAMIMMHEASISDEEGGFSFSTSDMEDHSKRMKDMQDGLYAILAERSKLTPSQIKRRCNRKESWIRAKEAAELELIDAIEV